MIFHVHTSRLIVFTLTILAGLGGAHGALVHRYSFDSDATDSVGGAHGVLAGDALISGGQVHMNFGARDGVVSLPGGVIDIASQTELTLEVWATPDAALNSGFNSLLGFGRPDPGDPGIFNRYLILQTHRADDITRVAMSTSDDGTPWDDEDGANGAELNDNVEHHYVATIDASTISLYIDGALVASGAIGLSSGLGGIAPDQALIGDAYANDPNWAGAVNEVRIHDTVLSESEILLSALNGPDGGGVDGVDGLIHRWSFSETGGTVLSDSVAGANGQVIIPGGGGGGHAFGGGQLRLFGGAKDTSDFIQLPPSLLAGLTDVTLEAWATPYSARNWARLFDFGSGVGTDNTFFLSFARGTDLNAQRLEFDTPAAWTLDTGVATTAGQEHHYVAVWSASGGPAGGGRAAWYRDGVLIGELDTGATSAADVDDTVLWLGRSQWPDETADADFNEFRIYNRVLTPSEINFNRANGPDNVTVPPVEPVDDFMTLNPGAQALIPVMDNDAGAEGNPATVSVVSGPSFGTAQVDAAGRIRYSHDGGVSVADQFSYTVQNSVGETSLPGTVYLSIDPSLRLENTTITIPDAAPPVTYTVENAFPGLFFEDALAIRTPPGRANQIFVAERRGIISYIPDIHAPTPVRQVLLDITGQVVFDDSPQGEMGLLGFDFHPGFETNGYLFVFYMAPGGSPYIDRLSRFTADPVTLTVNPATEVRLFDVQDQVFNHNGGDVHFGPDGYLYIGTGDEGDQYNQRQNAQRIDKDLYSALLRIDVDKRPGSLEPSGSANDTTIYTDGGGVAYYSIPPDNPFVGATTFNGAAINTSALRSEIFALGFRHIWRFSIDDVTGEIWVGDVGQDRWEEVNIVTNGGNYGWAYYEGTHQANQIYAGQPTLPDPPAGFVHSEPIYEYIHAGQGGDPSYHGDSVTGGVIYRGSAMPELEEAYLFADFEFQNLWALRRSGTDVTVERLTAKLGIAAFGVDPSNGEVLLANYLDNQIQRLVRSGAGGDNYPTKLSDTGIYADLTTLEANPGIVQYEPKVRFWSDNAIKTRWFSVPDLAGMMDFAMDDNWTLPVGMKFIKHFDLELELGNPATKKRVETRVLTLTTNGPVGVSYKWNEAGTEAFLVPDEGETFFVTVTNGGEVADQFYEIPSRAGCLACHTEAGGLALTFNTREMNHDYPLNGHAGNQIETLEAAGYFSGPVPDAATLPVHYRADDTTATLEARVRTYLAVNCAQCHQAGGTGGGFWDGRAHLTLEETGLINGLLDKDGGDPANRLVVPGDPSHSVVWLRMLATNGFSRMPPIGSHVLDQEAINLVAAWIDVELSGDDIVPPAAPTGLAAAPGNGAVSLDWDDNPEPDLAEYSVYRSTLSGGPYTAIASGVVVSAYVDASVVNGVPYYYVVTAIDTASNESATSGEVTALPQSLNTPPVFTADPINEVPATEDLPYGSSLADDAFDPDLGDVLTFTKVSGPAWLGVAPDGTLSGVPGNLDVGLNVFAVRVADGVGALDDAVLNITVNNVNDAPAFTTDPITEIEAAEDAAYAGTLADDATDVDAGDALTFSKISGPGWLGVAANGLLSGTPANEDVGLNAFAVRVADVAGAFDDASLNITVVNVNDSPVFASDPLIKADATTDQPYSDTLAGDADDVDSGDVLTFSKVSGPAWLGVAANGALTGTPGSGDAGANSWLVEVSDLQNATDQATLEIEVGDGVVQDVASTEVPIGGTVTGDVAGTQVSDDVYQAIQEIESGGKPSRRHSYLEHKWIIDVTGGSSITLVVEAHQSPSIDGDNFVFAWSTDDVSYTDALTVTKTADDDVPQSVALPASLAGPVYIRVRDTDQTQSHRALDTVFVDQLFIQSQAMTGPPSTPTGLVAVPGDGQITLSWNTASGADSYNLKRAAVSGGPYTTIAGGLGGTSYQDAGLNNGTTYHYVVSAVNAQGESADSTEASGTPAVADTMHVQSILVGSVNVGQGWKQGSAEVQVLDANGVPVPNATVAGTFTGSFTESVMAITDANGRVVMQTTGSVKGGVSITFCVDDVSHLLLTYDADANQQTCGSL